MRTRPSAWATALLLQSTRITAFTIDVTSEQSLISGASTAAYGLMAWYNANQTGGVPGNLPDPYYWWECGAMMMSMVDYWYYTGDSTYNDQVIEAMVHQVGENEDYMPRNQTLTLGNDDQAFWGFAAMEAAELGFPAPPPDRKPWIQLAQAVVHTQIPRWETQSCNGGLRWQIFPFNAGWNYKNTISNGCFFNLAARLARYTGNITYATYAERTYDWVLAVGLVDREWQVFDGTDNLINCSDVNRIRWTYNTGVMMHGAAVMWNITQDQKWRTAINGMIESLDYFFPRDNGVMVESSCQPIRTCNQDQKSFKAFLSRWMAATTQLAPWTAATLMPLLATSAVGAARQCTGGSQDSAQPGRTCGMNWESSEWDGLYGPGEQMAVMSVIGANLVTYRHAPLTEGDGGTSESDATAGLNPRVSLDPFHEEEVSAGDKAGAAIMTLLIVAFVVGGSVWVVL